MTIIARVEIESQYAGRLPPNPSPPHDGTRRGETYHAKDRDCGLSGGAGGPAGVRPGGGGGGPGGDARGLLARGQPGGREPRAGRRPRGGGAGRGGPGRGR